MIGPYELHDFNLYYMLRFGYPPAKVAFLAYCAWHDARRGGWPDVPPADRHQYTSPISRSICARFCSASSRPASSSAARFPTAPKVGSGGSLSPRGDWRAPSDSEAAAWLTALDLVPDRE